MKKLAFDIGSNLGKFTKKYLGMGYKIIAVEPNPTIFDQYQKQFKDIENVTALNKAVSSEQGEIEYYIPNNTKKHEVGTCDKTWFDGRFSGVFNSGYKTIKIQTISIDELIQTYGEPDFIKIDVEGYELNVVKSMTKKHCPLRYEWTSEIWDQSILVLKYLKELGYSECNLINGDNTHKTEPKETQWVSIDEGIVNYKGLWNPTINGKWGDVFVR